MINLKTRIARPEEAVIKKEQVQRKETYFERLGHSSTTEHRHVDG